MIISRWLRPEVNCVGLAQNVALIVPFYEFEVCGSPCSLSQLEQARFPEWQRTLELGDTTVALCGSLVLVVFLNPKGGQGRVEREDTRMLVLEDLSLLSCLTRSPVGVGGCQQKPEDSLPSFPSPSYKPQTFKDQGRREK